MKNSEVIIFGAGPGGLACAYELLKQGIKVTIVEKEEQVGGLMKSVNFKDYSVDYGFKNLDDGIPEVHHFWKELLKKDYTPIELRTGILYQGRILELDKKHKGLRRGMPYPLLLNSVVDMVVSKLRYRRTKRDSLATYTYERRGEKFTKIFTQEYSERSRGSSWSKLPAPNQDKKNTLFSGFLSDAVKETSKMGNSFHPRRGSGQIIEVLESKIRNMGGALYLNHKVTSITFENEEIKGITINKEGEETVLKSSNYVSSLPLQLISSIMGVGRPPLKSELSFQRGVIMVYLFLNVPAKFPHNSLRVSCPDTTISRITNYAAFGGEMIPEGTSCLCLEYFIPHSKALLDLNDKQIKELALSECENSNLLSREECIDYKVIRNLHADSAQSWEDYQYESTRKRNYESLLKIRNLYQISRTGADKSTYAGIMAAKSIVENNKEMFEVKTRPDQPSPWENS